MGERLKNAGAKVKEFVGKISKRTKIIILIVLVLALAAVAGLMIHRANLPYTILFTDLSNEDMASVLSYLDEAGVTDYRVEENNTILVKEAEADRLRGAIYMQGYPNSGFNYGRYLDNVGMLSSESDRAALRLFELQDRLSATVKMLDGVKEAQVNITEGSDTSFILTENVVHAQASVTVEMQAGRALTKQMVTAIQNMVSHSAEGLDITEVVVMDSAGNTYDNTEDVMQTLTNGAELKLALESQVDNNIRAKILEQLVPMFGLKNVSVSVASTVDVSRTYREDMIYNEPEWADRETMGQGIIGSRVWGNYIVRGAADEEGGVVGTTTNADLNEYVVREADLNGLETEINTSGEINYNVGYTKMQTEPVGTVTDLSVAVAINSSISENEIETAQLVPLVARAARIDPESQADKIAIVVYPFYTEPVPVEEEGEGEGAAEQPDVWMFGLPRWVLYAAIGGVGLFVLLLVLILLLRRRAKKKKQKKAEEERQQALAAYTPEQLAMLTPEQLASSTPDEIAKFFAEMQEIQGAEPQQSADIMDLHTERSMELRKDVRQFTEENPMIAAQMLKNWLRGGEEHG
ncbi:MAG: flagellar M-ring protein FliF [Oscillospiraceae bacterium]|nr:flagellar M-ring protein FliF [Oscillospiraceae bacterium]